MTRQPQHQDLSGKRVVGAAFREQQGGAGPQDAIQQAMLVRMLHVGFEKTGRGQCAVELRIRVGTVGRLLQERHHLGVGGKQFFQLLLVGRRQRPGRVTLLGIPRRELFLDRVQVAGRAAEKHVRVLLGRDRLAGEVRKLHRIARLAESDEAALKPCSGAPDEVRVEHQQDGDRGSRDDRDPFEDSSEAFHRRFP